MSTEDKENLNKDEKYPFIKEQIIPRKNHKVRKLIILVILTIVLAIIFGVVCRLVFEVSGPFVEKVIGKKDNQKVISFPTTSPNSIGGSENGEEEQDGDLDDADSEKEGNDTNNQNASEGDGDKNTSSSNNDESKTIVIEQTIAATLKDYQSVYQLLSEVANEVNKSIVTVTSVTSGIDWFNNESETANVTSGVIIANNGERLIILTSYDRIKSTTNIKVTFPTEVTTKAKLLNKDSSLGLAIITVDLSDIPKTTLDTIGVATLGESYSLSVGDPIIAVGSPNGYTYSVDYGMISNRVNYAYITDNKVELFNTDIDDNPNGEGVIINLRGEVIGIITQKFKSDLNKNINTAIAISRLKTTIEDLVNQTEQVYIGIIANDLTTDSLKSLDVSGGVYVNEVETSSPAYEAGLQSGDIIVKIDNSTISSVNTLYNILGSKKPKDTVKFVVQRKTSSGNKELTFKVELEQKK